MFNVPPFLFSPIALPCCFVGMRRCICCHRTRWSLTLSPAGSQQREPPDAEVGEAGGRWQIRLPRRGPTCRSRREGGFSHGQRWAISLILYVFFFLVLLFFFVFPRIGSQMHTRKVVSCIHIQAWILMSGVNGGREKAICQGSQHSASSVVYKSLPTEYAALFLSRSLLFSVAVSWRRS